MIRRIPFIKPILLKIPSISESAEIDEKGFHLNMMNGILKNEITKRIFVKCIQNHN